MKTFLKSQEETSVKVKVCTTLNYIEHFLMLTSTITVWISIFAFVYLLGIPIGFISSSIGLKICAIAAGIKK